MFAKLKALFALNKFYQNTKEAIKVANHNYLSTEFLAKVITQLLLVMGTLHGIIPVKIAVIASASLTALYMIVRTIYKVKNPGKDLPDLPAVAE